MHDASLEAGAPMNAGTKQLPRSVERRMRRDLLCRPLNATPLTIVPEPLAGARGSVTDAKRLSELRQITSFGTLNSK